jgi:hypothetical protein
MLNRIFQHLECEERICVEREKTEKSVQNKILLLPERIEREEKSNTLQEKGGDHSAKGI